MVANQFISKDFDGELLFFFGSIFYPKDFLYALKTKSPATKREINKIHGFLFEFSMTKVQVMVNTSAAFRFILEATRDLDRTIYEVDKNCGEGPKNNTTFEEFQEQLRHLRMLQNQIASVL